MLKQIAVWALLLVGSVGALSAQSNQKIDELLSQAQAQMGTTSYLLMASAGLVAEDTDTVVAFDAAVSAGFVPKGRKADDPVSVEDLSFLVMMTMKVPGGLEWSLLPNPRAAYRELAFQGVINTSAGPNRKVAGDEVIRTLNGAVALKGGQE